MQRLTVKELVAMAGGLLLGIAVFAPWYAVVSPLATLGGNRGIGEYSAWEVHQILRWLLLLAAIAPFILAYIILRDHQLTWARGELTAVVSIIALGVLLYI